MGGQYEGFLKINSESVVPLDKYTGAFLRLDMWVFQGINQKPKELLHICNEKCRPSQAFVTVQMF